VWLGEAINGYDTSGDGSITGWLSIEAEVRQLVGVVKENKRVVRLERKRRGFAWEN